MEKRIITIVEKTITNDKNYGCGECASSCQSACKTSCTVGNQSCQNQDRIYNPSKKNEDKDFSL